MLKNRKVDRMEAITGRTITGKENPTEQYDGDNDDGPVEAAPIPSRLETLFEGIRFRTDGKEEAIRRVGNYVEEAVKRALHENRIDHDEMMDRANGKIRDLQAQIFRLERSITQIKEHSATELITACNGCSPETSTLTLADRLYTEEAKRRPRNA